MKTQLKASEGKPTVARRAAMIAALTALVVGLSAPAVQAAEAPVPSATTVVAGPFTVVASVEHVSGDAWRFTYAVTNDSVASDYTGIPAWQYGWENGIDHSGLGGLDLKTAPDVSFSEVDVPAPSFSGGVSDGVVNHYGYWDWTTWLADGARHGEFWGHEPMAIYPVGQTVTFSFVASPVSPGMDAVKLSAYRYAEALRHPDDPAQWFSYYEPTLPVPVSLPISIQTPSALVSAAIGAGTLTGLGPNEAAAAGKLHAFQQMLAEADATLAAGDTAAACTSLDAAYSHADGHPRPPDFVTGVATGQVAAAIEAELTRLGCP